MPRPKAKTPPVKTVSYLFEIISAEPSYMFSANTPDWDARPYGEYWHLEVTTRCLSPAKIAGRLTRLLFLADRQILLLSRDKAPGSMVGTLTMRGARSEYLGSLPYDATWGIVNAIAVGQFKYVTMSGPALIRGSSSISYVAFQPSYEPDEYLE